MRNKGKLKQLSPSLPPSTSDSYVCILITAQKAGQQLQIKPEQQLLNGMFLYWLVTVKTFHMDGLALLGDGW